MGARKVSTPGEVEKSINREYDEVKLRIGVRIQAGQIVMQFSDEVEWVRMTSAGARKLATTLVKQAAILESLSRVAAGLARPAGTKSDAAATQSPAKGAGDLATPRKRVGPRAVKPPR